MNVLIQISYMLISNPVKFPSGKISPYTLYEQFAPNFNYKSKITSVVKSSIVLFFCRIPEYFRSLQANTPNVEYFLYSALLGANNRAFHSCSDFYRLGGGFRFSHQCSDTIRTEPFSQRC